VERLKLNGSDKFPAYNWFDLAVGYKFHDKLRLTLGCNNILDKEPPLGRACRTSTTGRATTARTTRWPLALREPAVRVLDRRPTVREGGPSGGRLLCLCDNVPREHTETVSTARLARASVSVVGVCRGSRVSGRARARLCQHALEA